MIRRLALALIALGSMSFAQTAHADCTTANGAVYQPGGIIYNSAHAVLQYCAGTVWRSLGGAAGTDGPLPNLTDVDDALAPNDGECLIYNGTNTQWETGACGSGGGASDLADLGDVDVAGVADGACLVFNNTSGSWEDGACGSGAGVLQGTDDAGPCTIAKNGLIRFNPVNTPPWQYCDGGTTSWLPFRLPQCQNDGAGECTLSALRSTDDPQFLATNIKDGANVLGITGTLVEAAPDCTDDSAVICTLEATRANDDPQLIPANIRTGINILNVAGSIPNCANDSAAECILQTTRSTGDAQFIAGNILDGINILGVTGTATAAGAACTNDMTGECTLSATRSSSDAQFTAASIRCGQNILGVTGTYGLATSSAAFTFTDVTNANPSTLTTATAVTISGIGGAGCQADVTVSGTGSPQISIAGGAWGTSGLISNGQTLAVRLTSSASFSTAHTATVFVGSTQDTWSVTTVAADTTPDAFNFAPDVTNATLSTLTTASAVTINGINTTTPVSVSGTGSPQISINGGAWTTSGNITNGQTLAVRLTSSASFSTANTATVNVGGITDVWSVTTFAIDTTPNGFTFTDQVDVQPNTLITSNSVTITGINTGASVSVSGAGSPQISIGGGAWVTSGTINSGQTLAVRLTSSSTLLTARTATVDVGGVTDVWSVTTRNTRFIFEAGTIVAGTNTLTLAATAGATWDGIEKMSYVAIAQGRSASSRTFSTFLFDGAAPAWQQAAIDNGGSEHISGGLSIHYVNPADTAQTVAYNMSGSVDKQLSYLRIIGGAGNLSVVYSDFRGNGPVWPYAYNIPSLQVGDIVVSFLSYRGTAGSSATNMTPVFANSTPFNLDVYATQITTAGTFSTTLNAPGKNQQWVHGIIVLREN